MTYVKVTNVKVWTGGGQREEAVPQRIRRNQNRRMYIPDWFLSLPYQKLKQHIDWYKGYTMLTSTETKVVIL